VGCARRRSSFCSCQPLSAPMPAVWASTTPLSVLLGEGGRSSCDMLQWSRRDPTPRPCLAEAARISIIQREKRGMLNPLQPQDARRSRHASYHHTATCILPKLPDGTRPLTITRAAADERIGAGLYRPRSLPSTSSSRVRTHSPAPSTFELPLRRPLTPPPSSRSSEACSLVPAQLHARPLSSPAKVRRASRAVERPPPSSLAASLRVTIMAP